MDADVAYYKFIRADGRAPWARNRLDFTGYLPTRAAGGWQPGPWLPEVPGTLALCSNGYHWCRLGDLPLQLARGADRLLTVEPGADFMEGMHKGCSRTFRALTVVEQWSAASLRALAVRTVARALPEVLPHLDGAATRVVREALATAAGTEGGLRWSGLLFTLRMNYGHDRVAYHGLDAVNLLTHPDAITALILAGNAVELVRREAVIAQHPRGADSLPSWEIDRLAAAAAEEERTWRRAQLCALVSGQGEAAA